VTVCQWHSHQRGCQPPQLTQLLPVIRCSTFLKGHSKENGSTSLYDKLPYFFTLENSTYYFTRDFCYKEFVHFTILFLIAKTLPPYSLINHIIDNVFCLSNIFSYPNNISICDTLNVGFFKFLGVREKLSPLGTSATIWPIVSVLDDG
jgi:hypothetical protein